MGFVSDLPTHLVAAFRATLEEVIEADLILNVRDIADPDTAAQSADVYAILDQLGIPSAGHERVLEVWNKIDLLDEERLEAVRQRTRSEEALLVSAQSGEGVANLKTAIEARIAGHQAILDINLALDAMDQLGWIYENTHVIDRTDREDGTLALKLRVPDKLRSELENRLAA
ncbi:MAG: hypothetical protein AAFO68_05735 [Pseudomonadota bacterium]